MTTSYPLVRRLLATLGADWRAERTDPFDYLLRRVDGADAAAVAAELGELCAAGRSEYDYVSLIVESGARFTPYGEFGTAADFVHQLRDRLARARPPSAAEAAAAAEDGPDTEPAPAAGGDLDCPRLRSLLVMLYAKGLTTPSRALDAVDHGLGQLIDRGDVEPRAVAAELAELLEGEHTEGDLVGVLTRAGVGFTPDPAYPTTTDFLGGLRQRLVDPAAGGPECGTTPAAVVEATLTALKQGDLHAGMTGLARMYGAPELGTAAFPAFEERVGELLDHVLPHGVAEYVDDATLAAETVADDAGWTRARWMRSAIELVITAHAGRAAAAYVDRSQVEQIDDLLCAPTCGFGVPAGRTTPRLPNSHWWWSLGSRSTARRAGLPMHPRWYPAQGVWRVRVPLAVAGAPGGASEAAMAGRFSRRLLDATTAAFGAHLSPSAATAMVQVLDADGAVHWADASLAAEVRDGTFAVTDPDLEAAPPGERVVTVATVRGAFGRGGDRAEWSVEVMRRRGDDGRVVTTGGSAVFSLAAAGELGAGDAATLAAALRDWERELGAPLTDWRSSTHPTLVSRYGWGCDVFADGPPRTRPLLTGVSRHLWAGELRLGLVGLCRAHGAGLLDDGTRVWQDDWTAALAHAGRAPVEELLTGMVDETRRLDYSRWHQLCAARSGIQLVGERLDDERLAGLFPVDLVRRFDDAMRSFGRRFGPVPLAHVPGGQGAADRLWDDHPWWRYPANASDAGALVDLDGLAAALWEELDRPERERRTKASTRSLASVVRTVQAVCEGESAGFTDRVAATVCDQVTERWDLGASLTDDVLKYFQPIARSSDWPLPAHTVQR